MPPTPLYFHLTRPAAVLRATGPDAFTFLQSQFSADLDNEGVENPVTYGLWLDHKGKIQADSFIIEQSRQEFLIMSYDCPAATVRGHLEAHLIADEVTLADETAAHGLLHLWAKVFDRSMEELVNSLVDPEVGQPWLGRRPGAPASWDYLAPYAALEKFANDLESGGLMPASAEALEAARIFAGVPSVPVDAGPGDLPQEACLGLDAVSYDKGCYLGQEVMQRIHTQGHANRTLWRIGWGPGAKITLGTEPVPLFARTEPAGELRSRVVDESGGMGLAMLKNRAISGRPSLSLSPGGPEAVRLQKNLTET